jgi:hypothetical protein
MIRSLSAVTIDNLVMTQVPASISIAHVEQFNAQVNISTVKDFPLDLFTYDKQKLTIKPFKQNMLPNAHVHNITVELRGNVINQIIRIRLHHNVICSPQLMNTSFSEIQNIFLERHPMSYGPSNEQNREHCYVWIPLQSRIFSFQIDYRFGISNMCHEIVARLVPKEYCQNCSINVTIIEYY